jgi:hypothetical protein
MKGVRKRSGLRKTSRGPEKNPLISGGKGSTKEDAVVISVPDSNGGISAEYEYVEKKCGSRGKGWRLVRQGVILDPDRQYDILTVKLRYGTFRDFYFDITAFFGRW